MRRVELLLMRYFRHLSFHEKHGHIQSVFVHRPGRYKLDLYIAAIDIPRPRPTNCSSRVCAGRSIRASDADDVISIPHPQPAPRDKFPDLAMLYQAVRKSVRDLFANQGERNLACPRDLYSGEAIPNGLETSSSVRPHLDLHRQRKDEAAYSSSRASRARSARKFPGPDAQTSGLRQNPQRYLRKKKRNDDAARARRTRSSVVIIVDRDCQSLVRDSPVNVDGRRRWRGRRINRTDLRASCWCPLRSIGRRRNVGDQRSVLTGMQSSRVEKQEAPCGGARPYSLEGALRALFSDTLSPADV
ncbi:hypothetical protein BD310DRAFT_271071 [Dichomitus squalens]|uniref:Uncharacterized protein n=1 Tax=Dichomitus squalens TaxID=114155 RepID=A0A4Q9Q1M7_9APHY|nr:hypothetical protein BD310DRAFT_271071 [Dichomitus squalens]